MLVRMLGIFGVILASGYLLQGVSMISLVRTSFFRIETATFLWALSVMTLDLVFGTCLFVAAIGLLFVWGWAKKMWLVTLSIVAGLHLLIATFMQLGRGVTTFYLIWTWMIMFALALSWWVLTRPPKISLQTEAVETPPLPRFE